MLAFESGNEAWVQRVLEAGVVTPEASRGLISALGLVADRTGVGADQGAGGFGPAGTEVRRDSCRGDASEGAIGLLCFPMGWEFRRSARSGPVPSGSSVELGLIDLHITARSNLRSKDANVTVWAAWSNVLLNGHKDAVACLQNIAEGGGPFAERAAQMAMRRLPPNDAKVWIKKLVKELGKETDRHHRRRRVCRSRGRPLPDRPDEGSQTGQGRRGVVQPDHRSGYRLRGP